MGRQQRSSKMKNCAQNTWPSEAITAGLLGIKQRKNEFSGEKPEGMWRTLCARGMALQGQTNA